LEGIVPHTKATPQEQVPLKAGPETQTETPLLDLSDAAVKKLVRGAKKRGYVTHDQINSVLPSEVNSEKIEDVLAMFSEMGVNVVETKETQPDAESKEESEEETGHPTDPRNLWPEPYNSTWQARIKDKLETFIKHRICATKSPMPLAEGQAVFRGNWVVALSGTATKSTAHHPARHTKK
jgi:hypothetical protein